MLDWAKKVELILDVTSGFRSVFSYSGGLNSCCSSCGHSWCTVLPPPPLGTGTVRSAYHMHPLAECHWCHTHTADNPGSFDALGCGNHEDKSHSGGLPHVSIREIRGKDRGSKNEGARDKRRKEWGRGKMKTHEVSPNNSMKVTKLIYEKYVYYTDEDHVIWLKTPEQLRNRN